MNSKGTRHMHIQSPYRLFVLLWILLSQSACARTSDSILPTGDAMIENLPHAREEVAQYQEEVFLIQVGSRYTAVDDQLVFEDYSYLFVSSDASYFVVRVHASGEVTSLPVAGKAIFDQAPYEFADNVLSEQDALDSAWKLYGAELVEQCGSLRWVDVGGGVDAGQWWRVGYRIGGVEYTIFLDAGTGEVIEMDEIICT